MDLITLEKIDMQFNSKKVLTDFTMTISNNEMVAITGPSGVGKSTVLNILGLLLQPTRGKTIHFGHENVRLNSLKAMKILREDIGYLFQNYALIDNDTVLQNMKLAAKYSQTKDKTSAIETALNDVGLIDMHQQKVHSLSGGDQQRLAMARLMVKPCQVILADEPTGNLDEANSQNIIQLLRILKDRGKSLVVVTHSTGLLPAFDRIISLEQTKEET